MPFFFGKLIIPSPLSVYVLTHNSEHHLARVLAAATQIADKLIVVDSGSADSTVTIASAFNPHVVYHPFTDFPQQRLFANSLCKHPMIMFFDSDEIASDELIKNILKLKEKRLYS